MKITFSKYPVLVNSDIDHDVEYSTNYEVDEYTLRILHCYEGIGMTDKYRKVSFIELYRGDDNVTRYFARQVGITEFPIYATIENLEKFIR